jgi:RNA polymerase sigma-70 factor (ECF subfamily)
MDDEALAALIRGAQGGDPSSFDELVDRFAGRVFGFLLRMTGSRLDAEDLMQEVFLRVVRMIGTYKHDHRFEGWLFRIAANLARDRVRRMRRGPRILGETRAGTGEVEEPAAGGQLKDARACDGPVEKGVIQAEELDALNAAMSRLPDSEREVIMLRHFSRLSFKDIAEVLGCPLGTALARSHRGLQHLRRIMESRPTMQS